MSLNRFAALYFATRHLRISDFPITGIAIIGAFAVAILYTCLGFRRESLPSESYSNKFNYI